MDTCGTFRVMGQSPGQKLETVIDVDFAGPSFRVRMNVDLTKPLHRLVKVLVNG